MTSFRKVCRWLHRELGFFTVGLTLVYAISGIAVNHAHHWDANYQRKAELSHIEAPGAGPTTEVLPIVLERLQLDEPVKSTWRASDSILQVFLEGGEIDVDLISGEVIRRGFKKRLFFYDLNFMHLNTGKAPWTGIADAYAGILILLAVTGIFLVRGRKGLAGRGGVLMAIGVVLPIVYAIIMRA